MWPIRIRHPSLYLFYCPDFPIRLPSTCHIRVLFKFILFYYFGFAVRHLTLGDIRLPHTWDNSMFYCLDFAIWLPTTFHIRLISWFVLFYDLDIADPNSY